MEALPRCLDPARIRADTGSALRPVAVGFDRSLIDRWLAQEREPTRRGIQRSGAARLQEAGLHYTAVKSKTRHDDELKISCRGSIPSMGEASDAG